RILSWQPERVDVDVPANAATGDVFLTNTAGASNTLAFQVLPPPPPPVNPTAPLILSISPDSAWPGRIVTLTGRNFTEFRSPWTFSGAPGLSVFWAATRIGVFVPRDATTGPVVVTAPTGVSPDYPYTITP